MNKKLLPLLFVVSLSAQAQTNVYHPFPDSGAVWIMNYVHVCLSSVSLPGCYHECHSNYQYRVDGDTVLFGNTYKKIIRDSYLSHCVCNMVNPVWGYPSCIYYPFYSLFFCGIRNDSINKLVYKTDGSFPEQIFYDFNLNVGDTIHSIQCYNRVILKIDSALVGGDYRKCYWLDTINTLLNDKIIEGVGNVGWGPFDGCGPIVADFGWSFSCLIENGNVVYGDSSCSLVTSADNILYDQTSVILFPNPSTNQLTIDVGQLKIESVEIYNTLGEKVYFQREVSNQQPITVNVSQLLPEVYLIVITDAKGNKITRRFVKM